MYGTTITTTQARTLAKCEAIIERGQKVFLEVGKALMQIRDEKLYLRDYEPTLFTHMVLSAR